jgi:hypothetical protein
MNIKATHFKRCPALSALATLLWFSASAGAQTMPDQKSDDSTRATRDRDSDRQERARFGQFLDSHREIAEQVRKDPSLLNSKEFVGNHPALQSYLQEHPGVRDEIKQDPSTFMRQEDRYDRREDISRGDRNGTRPETARFDQFLDSHREIAERLRKNPSLINDQQYLKEHPALQSYLQDHPAVRQEITQNPNAFMQAEERYDQHENDVNRDRDAEHNNVARSDRNANPNNTATSGNVNQRQSNGTNRDRDDRDANRGTYANRNSNSDRGDRDSDRQERARFDQFLDNHRETAEQLRKDPSLANNPQFLKNHTALQTYLQDHPAVRSEIKNDPNGFMQDQDRFDRDRAQSAGRYGRYDDNIMRNGRDRDRAFTHSASFGEFLNAHTNVAQQLSKDPSLVKNQEYMKNHPELQSYLDAHPEEREQLMQNPQGFLKSAQQLQPFNNGQTNNNGQPAKPPSATTTDPTKPKQ